VGGYYRRYCDDILFICDTADADAVEAHIVAAVRRCAVEINADKTERCTFTTCADGRLRCDVPVQYLGFTFDGVRRLVRSSTLARYHRKMRRAVRRCAEAAHLQKGAKLYRRTLYERYSHLGTENVVQYGYRAAHIMRAPEIRRQLHRHWELLALEIARRS
jgi:hypothetical protein